MTHLRLFGGVSLRDEAGPIAGPAAQRHRLALLALLVSAHPGGLPRSRLRGLLWPDRDGVRGRNLLNQAVHQLRKRLGAATIRTVGHELHVDAAALSCDLLVFREALESGDLRRAAALQAGPFMDGFWLPAAASFERWVDAERVRLTSVLGDTLETLALGEEEAGDPTAAADLWRRRLELDPCLGRTVIGLMRSLEAAGNRAGAIRAAEEHSERIRQELAAAPDPMVVSAVERLRGNGGGADRSRDAGAWIRRDPPSTDTVAEGPVGRTLWGSDEPDSRVRWADRRVPIREPQRLIGRTAEWERLESCWRQVARGRAGFVMITGDPGIGKTRLADEFLGWVARRGVVTARARCRAAGGRLPFGPVADWLRSEPLRSSLQDLNTCWIPEVALLLPELAVGGRAGAEPSGADVASPRDWRLQRFFRALAEAVLGGRQPRLLVIDDLQWCDPDSLHWLHFLLRHGAATPLLVVGTARTDETGSSHPLASLLETLRGEEDILLTEFEAGPLDPQSTVALAADMAGRALDRAEGEQIFRETEGHPLFVVEAVRAGWHTDAAGAVGAGTASLPERVRNVIRSRLGRLSPAARAVAAIAATAGRAFGAGVALRASALGGEAVADALDELTDRRILRADEGAFDFTHDKLREVVYADLNPVRRMLLHGRVADALEHTAGVDAGVMAGAVADHWERAGDARKAVVLYQRAAGHASAAHGHEEAATYLSRALRLLPTVPTDDPIERTRFELSLQRELGDTLLRTRGWAAPEVAAAHDRELELAERVGDDEAVCRALWGVQSVRMVRAEPAAARSVGERLLALARERDDTLYLGAGHFTVGFASFLMGRFTEAAEHATRGRNRFETSPPAGPITSFHSDVRVFLSCLASHAAWFLGEPGQAGEAERSARELAEQLDRPYGRAVALTYAAMLHQYRGDGAAAGEDAEAAIAIADEFEFRYYRSVARVVRGWALTEGGWPGEGLRQIRSALRDYEATGSRVRYPYFLALEARAHARLGSSDRAREKLDHALLLCERTGERWYEPELRAARSTLLPEA